MRTALIALIVSITLMFSGQPIKKEKVVAAAKTAVKTEQTAKMTVPSTIPDYLKPDTRLYFSYQHNIYIYRNPELYIAVVKPYRFPVLGRLFRTHITVHGPEGRGLHIGLGQHTH